jgi:hypothetical protein
MLTRTSEDIGWVGDFAIRQADIEDSVSNHTQLGS